MRNKLMEIKRQYKEGKIAKQEFISQMHDVHGVLWDYKELINGENISALCITSENVTVTTKNGVSMICDPDDERIIPVEILNFGDYETAEINMITKFLKDDSVIFDIGANIGWYSLNLSGVVSKGKIFAFEPIPKTHDYLVRNIASNKITNVQVQNYGLSEKEGTLEFYFDPKLGGSTSLRNLNENSKKVLVKCKVKRLDQIAPSLSKTIDFIKCDVEGAELFVMRGAIETLKKCEPVIFLEMLRKWAKKFDYHPNEIIKLLGTLGYECYYAENGKLRKISEIDDNTMATNFFFLKPEKHAVLLKKMS